MPAEARARRGLEGEDREAEVPDEGHAGRRFVAPIDGLSRRPRLQGPAPDCAALLAAIVAEDEAERLWMESDLLDRGERDMPRSGPSPS